MFRRPRSRHPHDDLRGLHRIIRPWQARRLERKVVPNDRRGALLVAAAQGVIIVSLGAAAIAIAALGWRTADAPLPRALGVVAGALVALLLASGSTRLWTAASTVAAVTALSAVLFMDGPATAADWARVAVIAVAAVLSAAGILVCKWQIVRACWPVSSRTISRSSLSGG